MITSKEIDQFERVYPFLDSLAKSFSVLSSKKPGDILNDFKLTQINSVLADCNAILGEQKPNVDFNLFDTAILPLNSDVYIVLNLYVTAMDKFREANSDLVGCDPFADTPHLEWKLKRK